MKNSKIEILYDLCEKYRFSNNKNITLPLWHYTSADGFLGIIRNEPNEHGKLHFWFTRSDCLNDTSEGNHILNLFQRICERMLNKNKIDNNFYNCIKGIEIPPDQFLVYPIVPPEGFAGAIMSDCVPCDAFICSFSLKEDSLDMWRYYSKGNGGYGLKLKPFIFDKQKEFEHSLQYQEDTEYSIIRSYEVIYDDKIKEEILEKIITDTFSVYRNSNDTMEKIISEIQGVIRFSLKFYQFQFKHECYASEKEYRFVFFRPRTTPKKLNNKLPCVKYRAQNGIVVPYIDITVDNGNSMLDEVLISPYIENNISLDTAKNYLAQCGFCCEVKKSLLPVRY